MVAVEVPANASLAELLGARARRTPRDRLVLDLVGGAAVAAAAAWARPGGWVVIASAAGCFACYGAWALTELRLRQEPGPEGELRDRLWRTARGTAAALGLGAFVLLLLAALGVALGPIKS